MSKRDELTIFCTLNSIRKILLKGLKSILLIDDDQVDAIAVKRGFKEINVSNQVIHVENGAEALYYLTENLNRKPSIILLDLNMPVMNGIEFLEERIKSDELKIIPVIVLTNSNDRYDKENSFKLSASGYMVKPVEHNGLVDMLRKINKYWTISERFDN